MFRRDAEYMISMKVKVFGAASIFIWNDAPLSRTYIKSTLS